MKRLIIDKNELLEVLQQMIRVESVNPTLVKGGNGESEIANFLIKYLAQAGLKVQCQEIGPKRKNVIGILKGTGGGRSIILNGHTDTVSLEGMKINPLEPEYREGRVYGRGSLDMKGGLAAIIIAVKALIQGGVSLNGDVILAFVADEEYASMGTEALVKEYRADAAIICEPTDLKICIAHKGFAWTKVEVFGRAAHGSRPDQGIDAISKAGKVLIEMEKLGNHVLTQKSHPLLGSPSIHASLISGGTELSIYPSYCRIEMERRTIPGESYETVRDEMKNMIDKISSEDRQFRVSFDVFFHRPPLEVSRDELIVKTLSNAYEGIFNKSPEYIGSSGWMDSAIVTEKGIPTVIFGPGGEGLHAEVEYVDFETVVDTAKVLAGTIVDFCNS
ncbi:MAG TPA: peptidase M20 [Pelotomaculum sp.]|nr:peptidase M20 [Pelotomaculum sp.]